MVDLDRSLQKELKFKVKLSQMKKLLLKCWNQKSPPCVLNMVGWLFFTNHDINTFMAL